MPDRLTEIRARLDAATPGPWSLDAFENGWFDSGVRPISGTDPREEGHFPLVAHAYDDTTHNADLIAHAPADIAWLLAEVERLRGDDSVAQGVTKRER